MTPVTNVSAIAKDSPHQLKKTLMRILLDITVVAILVVAAWAYVSIATKKYGAVSIWPM
jgi:hypothetical protein